jgi:hypothetical protein
MSSIAVSPVEGTEVASSETLSLDVTDGDVLIVAVLDAARDLVHDGTAFAPKYATSTRYAITGGFHYDLRRIGGWSGRSVTIKCYDLVAVI